MGEASDSDEDMDLKYRPLHIEHVLGCLFERSNEFMEIHYKEKSLDYQQRRHRWLVDNIDLNFFSLLDDELYQTLLKNRP